MKKSLYCALALVAVGAILAACGSNKASSSAPASSTAARPASAAAPTTATAASPASAATSAAMASTTSVVASPQSTPEQASTGPRVVAATSWAGAFAVAAGARDVQLIAPANVQHPPDYDAKPSDIAKVSGADYVLYGGFEGFAQRIKEAVGGKTQLVQVNLDNSPETVRKEVLRLAGLFGTTAQAQQWLTKFDAMYNTLSDQVKAAIGDARPVVVAHAFMTPWAAFAGLQVAGTFGPQPLTAEKIAELAAKKPTIIFDNGHVPLGQPLAQQTGAKIIALINFPGSDLDLFSVYQKNAQLITQALGR
jgi:zinc transport system substrate-binding protein